MNKMSELILIVCDLDPDCIMVTEACSKNSSYPLSPVSVYIQGYDIFCNFDKSGIRGVIIQWKLDITRSLGPWQLPCYIRNLVISG